MATTHGSGQPPQFFTLIPTDTRIDFIALQGKMIGLSIFLILIGIASVIAHGGPNYGIDFAGGVMVEVRFPQATAVSDVRAAVEQAGISGAVVQDVGQSGQEFQIRAGASEGADGSIAADQARTALTQKFGEGSYDVLRVEMVGPKVGRDLWRNATLAVLASTVLMGVYLAARFDLRYGLGAAVALFHDVLITVGALSLANIEFDLTIVAALLTIVGFSVNDTVIIFDRIRENIRRQRTMGLSDIMNLSINETLSRTIITNGTALLSTMVLFFFGGTVIHGFAFALAVGVIVGTYSSIYVASPVVLRLQPRVGPVGDKR